MEIGLKRMGMIYIFIPYFYNGVLPKAEETDLLIILGGPMSPNDLDDWILKERELIRVLLKRKSQYLVLVLVLNK